ncbi:NAD(P)/FAD-dependent oxidoreductase [Steroidobacter agaridevorans]|uniref:NAD(P)/FAD-dependent oxidoreductase n=1 Tax=Steroidobacter agaridevorans TaxID=2695856 RepID=UPI00132194CA|nr:NAD(P)/FAD-dependent oxidoreductase [Steroidobacter agaridevorans]GFE91669.1 geranylgeranyl reductase [Steroidobacter agaridevorans]
MSADTCDVLIVGGGPAGSTCARTLRRAGLDVLIMDKSVFPRDKVCAGWITPQVVQELDLDVEDYRQSRVLQPINSFITGMGEQANAAVSYDKIVSYGIRRCEFDHYLLERSGARLRLGEAWKSMERQGDRWLVNGEISAPLVIGAGGHFCPVARFLGAHLGKEERAISAQEIEFELNESQAAQCSVTGERPELYFCDDLKGYGWCFRKGNYLNVGLGREGNHRLAEHVQTFARSLAAQGRIPADLPGKFKGHAYLLYAHGNRPVIADGVMIIGDAAGLAYTQSGEGIRPAIESGLLAAANVLAVNRDYRRERLSHYEAALQSRFGERGEAPALAMLPSKLRLGLARALMQTQWFARNVVLDRWFLHAQLPALSS